MTAYGPVTLVATPDSVADFIDATGDDPARWFEHAPPGYAAVALIAVAGGLLDEALATYGAVIHTRQRFEWHAPLAVGDRVEVTGAVTSTKERAGMTFVDFAAEAGGWVTARSSFLMTEGAAAESPERTEPPPIGRAGTEVPTATVVPAEGEDVAPLAKSASRLDIVRYAAASGDWNPIHWDHDSAVAAGLGGVIAHGLLAASWVAQAAARYSRSAQPLRSLDVRFRSPLLPAVAAIVGGSVKGVAPLELAIEISAGGETLITATAEVNE
jgi:acyl dehydratase